MLNKIKTIINKNINIKYIFLLTFIILGLLRIFASYYLNIDYLTIIIFLIAYIPWLMKFLKSFKMFGTEFVFIDEKKAKEFDDRSKELNNKRTKKIDNKQVEESIFSDELDNIDDEVMKLALIRINLEKELKIMCKNNNIDSFKLPIYVIIKKLREKKLLDNETCNLILDIVPVLNSAVHNEIKVSGYYNSLIWTIDAGTNIVNYLKKLNC